VQSCLSVIHTCITGAEIVALLTAAVKAEIQDNLGYTVLQSAVEGSPFAATTTSNNQAIIIAGSIDLSRYVSNRHINDLLCVASVGGGVALLIIIIVIIIIIRSRRGPHKVVKYDLLGK
jgi:hypothetical protein